MNVKCEESKSPKEEPPDKVLVNDYMSHADVLALANSVADGQSQFLVTWQLDGHHNVVQMAVSIWFCATSYCNICAIVSS